MSNSSVSDQHNGRKGIEIPRGWSRILEKDSILYISPNNSRLRSVEHVIEYLKTEGTCKCGLDCPFYIHKVFNFDARIPSKLVTAGSRPDALLSTCKHCAAGAFEESAVSQPDVTAQEPDKDARLPSFSPLAKNAGGQKRGPGRPRNTASKSNRTSVSKHAVGRPTSPLHNIPLPVPNSVNNSPVQSVPTNIAVNQGPLPSFATIVSSSKLFNPGASLGSTMLASNTVTSTVSSCPLTTVSLLSSKSNTVTQNVSVSSSAPTSLAKPAGLVNTAASKVASPTASSAPVNNQQPVTVAAQTPTTNKVATLPKHSTATDTNTGSLPITVSAHSSFGSHEALSVSKGLPSTVTSVLPTKGKATSPTNQIAFSSSDANKSSEVKASPKQVVPHTSKASRPYGGRKTVASTLKAAASAAKVSSALALTRPMVQDSSPQRIHTVATATPGASCQVVSAGRSSEITSQVLPLAPTSTTVQAPALFHNVLKGTMGQEQGQLSHHIATPSTQAQKTAAAPVVTSNNARLSHAVHSAHSKTETQEKDHKSVSLAQSALASHVSLRPQVHAAAQRSQQQASGYPANKSGTSFHGQVSLASSISQQASVPSTTLSQAHTQVQALASSVYGHGSSQIPSLQIAGSQTQGGVFVQGSGNQMFQMNVADSNQLKGAFQLQGALYQGALPTTFFAANNTAGKTAVPHAPGGVTQAVYSTNPYMLGILMPTAMSQSATSASGSSTVTATTSSVTTATAPVPSVASYSYNNQNAAIAAAFESFVPIAPAASPRFSQTLAHLASAYTPFVPRGVVQGNTPLQFTQRMVPMGSAPAQACGNGQMGAPVLNLTDYTLKYPINAVKPSSYTTQVSTQPSAGSVNTPQQAALVTAMPYVAFGQINNPRFPFAVNFASPGAGTNSSAAVSTPTGVGSAVASATSSHYAGGGTVNSHAGGAVLGYVAMPFNTNTGAGAIATPHPFTGSAFSAPSSNTGVSCSSQGGQTLGPQHVTWCGLGSSPAGPSQRGCHTPETNSPGCYTSTTSASVSLPLSRSSCANIVSMTSGIVTTTPTSTNCCQPAQSARYLGVSSPLNSPTTFTQSTTALPACPGLSANEKPKHVRKSSQEGTASQSQTYSASDCYKKRNSPPGMPCTLQRTCNEGSYSTKRTKYDESAYYEANPLLGLKRSCEAIEAAYSKPERDNGADDNDANFRRPAKNDKASPGGRSGEACTKSNNYENLNNCSQVNCGSEEVDKPREEQTTVAYDELSTERCQSYSVYNGDVTGKQDKEPFAQLVNQDPYPLVKTNPMLPIPTELPTPNTRPHFDIGDIVWAQARGLPSWPGKVVDEHEVGKGRPDDGKRWVMWFGDHTFSQVEVDRLKTLSDGLRTLDDKARKKKYRAKKARISLEQAISEALEALEIRERLRARQATRSKVKRKRIR